MKREYRLFCALIILVFLINSCKSSKFIPKGPFPIRITPELLNAINLHNHDFEWFSAKAKIKFTSPEESGRATVNIRMRKDSVIWMNIKKLSVEVSRIQITPDSLFIMYRLDQMFERSSYEDMMKYYGIHVPFHELQDLIVGNCLLPENDRAFTSTDSTSYFLDSVHDSLQIQYVFEPYTLEVQHFIMENNMDGEVKISYDEYKNTKEGLKFPHKREYLAISKKEEAIANINLSSVEFNVPKSIRFRIPGHYGEYR